MQTWSSPLLTLRGAVAAEGLDAGVAAHYGDPLGEQRRAVAGVGVADRSQRSVLHVGGPDRLGWLHSLTTQHLAALRPGSPTEALILSPHGHVEHHLVLHDDGEQVVADVEGTTLPELVGFLETMRFLLDVTVHDETTAYAVLTLVGPDAAAAAAGVAGSVAWSRATPWLGEQVDLGVARAELAEVWAELTAAGATPLGAWGLEALRVEARRPRHLAETDHRTIPQEVGWLETAVHLDKGCYRGQETVARVHNLGRPPRRMVLLHLDGSVAELPRRDDAVSWEGVDVGRVGTAALHHELGPVALAVVKRTTPDEAALLAGGVAATVDAAVTPA